MPSIRLTETLRREYQDLFATCTTRPARVKTVEKIVARLLANRTRYQAVASTVGAPWFFVAVVHNMESGLSFTKHLHNGDPLTRRTVHVPAGRPKQGNAPFAWEASATDALQMKGLSASTDWSLAGILYQLERYNGFGYRTRKPARPGTGVRSPYLWSFSNHYLKGKFTADSKYDPNAVSAQCGAAVLLRRMAERGEIQFADQPAPAPSAPPLLVTYSITRSSYPAVVKRVEDLQRWLNTFPGIFVKEDGIPGNRTSDAYHKVTGGYLPGDPRGS